MTIILSVHIILMVSSLVATATMAIFAAANKSTSKLLVRFNLFGTLTGILAGCVLLAQQPIGVKCAMLLAYTAVFAATHSFVVRRNQSSALSES